MPSSGLGSSSTSSYMYELVFGMVAISFITVILWKFILWKSSIVTMYEVQATFHGAKSMKGVRASLYWHAEKSVAYYAMNPAKSIYYQSSDLMIAVLFPTLRSAQEFQTFLNTWHYDNPFMVARDAISVNKIIGVKRMASGYTERILLNDYDGRESDSPLTSLESFQVPSRFTSHSSNIAFRHLFQIIRV